jgi:hypothetical protein
MKPTPEQKANRAAARARQRAGLVRVTTRRLDGTVESRDVPAAARTYRVSSLDTHGGADTRSLACVETGEVVADVVCDLGPVLLGDMTEERARELFPEAF